MKFFKDNLVSLLVLALIVALSIERCNQKPITPQPPKTVHDTIWVKKDSLIYSKPKVIKTIDFKDSLIYLPDTNYSKLVLQYQTIVNQLLAKNIHLDSIAIDTNGYVKIIDTVEKNVIVGRSAQVSIKYPIIKETTTIYPKPVNQLYVGGDVSGNKTSIINQVRAGIILKTKKDQIFTASVGLSVTGQPLYGVGSYWKIKLK